MRKEKGDSTGRTLIDLLVELAKARLLWVVIASVLTVFLVSWTVIHTIAEPGSQVSIWGLIQYTKRTPQAVAVSPPVPSVPPAESTGEVAVDIASVDTITAPGRVVAADPYLSRFGIFVTGLEPAGSRLVLINNLSIYGGRAVLPTTSQNFLTQLDTGNAPASFTLTFVEPVDGVTFMRPALYPATDSGITHPAWRASALDGDQRVVSSRREAIRRSYGDVSEQRYTLRRPGFDRIAAVRFDSDPRREGIPFAAFSTILIEELTLLRERSEPEGR